jgi:poly(A)-specific ribonuclease
MKIEEEKTLHIPLTNAYQKRYVYCYVGFKYPELFIQKNQDTTFTLEKLLEEQWKKVEIVQKSEKEEKYDKLVAFTKLWKELCQTEKTFIGHNCWADILFIYTHLIG